MLLRARCRAELLDHVLHSVMTILHNNMLEFTMVSSTETMMASVI